MANIRKENVANFRMLFPLALVMAATTAFAQVEIRLAYMTERPGTIPAVFPNDQLYTFMTASAHISASELKTASVSQNDERIGVAVRITESARRKFNRLAAANIKTLARADEGGEVVCLALLVDGQVHSLVQGIHRLPSTEVQLDMGDDRLAVSARLHRARSLAQRINASTARQKPR